MAVWDFPNTTRRLARELLGSYIITADSNAAHSGQVVPRCGGMIIETEAYTEDDPASHSYRRRTERNRVMFQQPGSLYVYRSYGIHHCMNIVSGPVNQGEAVLIRSLLPLFGLSEMMERRIPGWKGANEPVKNPDDLPAHMKKRLCSGPGNVCSALGIDMNYNGIYVCKDNDSGGPDWRRQLKGPGVYLVQRGEIESAFPEILPSPISREVRISPRIGIRKNADAMMRFFYYLPGYISRSAAGHIIA